VRAFERILVEQTTTSGEFWYGLLTEFVEREGHAKVPRDYKVPGDGHRLGTWVSSQRTKKEGLWMHRNAR
jgi:hypothetical protein